MAFCGENSVPGPDPTYRCGAAFALAVEPGVPEVDLPPSAAVQPSSAGVHPKPISKAQASIITHNMIDSRNKVAMRS